MSAMREESIEVEIGGQVVTVKPLRGLKRMKEFQDAMRERLDRAQDSQSGDPALAGTAALGLLFEDLTVLLKLGAPDVVTDELLERCTAEEAVELFTAICKLAIRVDQIEGAP